MGRVNSYEELQLVEPCFSMWNLLPAFLIYPNRNIFFETTTLKFMNEIKIKLQSEKIKLNFYFHTSLWCLKRFYEGPS